MKLSGSVGLEQGLVFSYGKMLGDKGLQEADLASIESKMNAAAQAIRAIFEKGTSKAHLSKDGTPEHVFFPRQAYLQEGYPNTEESIAKLEALGEAWRGKVDVAVFLGIGGSYLGDRVLFDVAAKPYWNELSDAERNGRPKIYFSGNNVDGTAVLALEKRLNELATLRGFHNGGEKLRVQLVPISKSGTTMETLTAFSYFYQALKNKPHKFELGVTAVTELDEKNSALYRLAVRYGWQAFEIPEGIGGRFCVFSNPGLLMAAAMGYSLRELLAGAKEMVELCLNTTGSANPALLNAGLKYLAAKKLGLYNEVLMGYGDNLKSLCEWYIQLMAESLGKRLDREGNPVNYGRTPIVAVGTTDMHSQTQLHQDGRLDKVVQFLQVGQPEQAIVPNPFKEEAACAKYEGCRLQDLLELALHANETALAGDNRLSARYILPSLEPKYVGQLLMFLMLSVAYEGELADVDAYDQPGVEAYKKIMKQDLKK